MPNTPRPGSIFALKPTFLIILDGFGLASAKNRGNAITPKTAPRIFGYIKKYPSTTLKAHGHDVGLFAGQAGNSEAGHLNIGAGRVVEQDLVRISRAISDGTFYKNQALVEAARHIHEHHSAAHVMGLLTDGQSSHARPEHLYAVLEFLRRRKVKRVYLHLFTDGRDSSPRSAVEQLRQLRGHMKNGEQIATISGRFYAMDRAKRWHRTRRAYNALVNGRAICGASSAEEALAQAYNRGETDEYVCPTVIKENGRSAGVTRVRPVANIKDHDAVFFFNDRSDRARQLTKALMQPDFTKKNPGSFRRLACPQNLKFVVMTDFGPDLPDLLTAFPSRDIPMSLAAAIGSDYRQLYISEIEKYAHVTYFINGGYAGPINGEAREAVPSLERYSYAEAPGMSAREITGRVLDYLKRRRYDFITINFANADMLGHTGNLLAAEAAIRVVDRCVHRLVTQVLKLGGQVIITADHGNAEEMINQKTGEIMTGHSTSPVPFIIVRQNFKTRLRAGRLADVAPTLLKLMSLEKPKSMTGKYLF